jgi:hypothetical protein
MGGLNFPDECDNLMNHLAGTCQIALWGDRRHRLSCQWLIKQFCIKALDSSRISRKALTIVQT